MGIAHISKKNFICNPKFAGTDETDKNSFMLSDKSRLIGKGITVEDDMGEHDFYGNPLTGTHNIGCYEGSGVKMLEKAGLFEVLGSFIRTLLGTVACFIINCNNRYWIF